MQSHVPRVCDYVHFEYIESAGAHFVTRTCTSGLIVNKWNHDCIYSLDPRPWPDLPPEAECRQTGHTSFPLVRLPNLCPLRTLSDDLMPL